MSRRVRALLVLSVTLVASPRLMAASTRTVVGRVVDLRTETGFGNRGEDRRPETLVIRAKSGGEVSVSLEPRTRYLKWVTRQPWQQSTRANVSLLWPGRLVAVEAAASGDRLIAHVVQIATE